MGDANDTEGDLDVRRVLAEIDAEESVAHLEARVEGLEQDLERATTRAQEADRGRAGELNVMRARIEDALELVREAVEEQRGLPAGLDQRFAALATDMEERVAAALRSLREEVAPRVERAGLHADEVAARVSGEVQAALGEIRGRIDATDESLAAIRATVAGSSDRLRHVQAEEREQLDVAVSELRARIDARLDDLAATAAARQDDLAQRIDALRRELDGTSGELRAGMNLRVQEIAEEIQGIRSEIDDIGAVGTVASSELERRWIGGTREIARRLDEQSAAAREAVRAERVAREEASHDLSLRLDEITTALTELEGRVSTASTRQLTAGDDAGSIAEDMAARLDAMQHRMTSLANEVGQGLADRLATVSAEVEALREASVRREQDTAGVSGVGARLGALTARVDSIDADLTAARENSGVDALAAKMSAIRRDLATLAGGVTAAVEQTQSVATRMSTLQDALRQNDQVGREVRELTERTAELGARLAETDRLARAAGQAIAGAVRRARASGEMDPFDELPGSPQPVEMLSRPIIDERARADGDL